jgi:hypothetical protein
MDFNWWEGLVAGALATFVMTALMQMGAAMGMTRMNMAVMLGSMFRRDPGSARSLGMTLHFMNGLAFGVLYALVWWAIDPADLADAWWIGVVFGAVHGVVAMAMMPVMSGMHPRVRSDALAVSGGTGAEVRLPPFGFGGRGFGAMTPMGILLGHLVFGVVWGLVFWWLA